MWVLVLSVMIGGIGTTNGCLVLQCCASGPMYLDGSPEKKSLHSGQAPPGVLFLARRVAMVWVVDDDEEE